MSNKLEYFSVHFDGPPSAQQLTEEFGVDGWQLLLIVPVVVKNKDETEENKLLAYFVRKANATAPAILTPGYV